MKQAFLIEGSFGDYEVSIWIVNAWTKRDDAERELARLNECAQQYHAERDALGKAPDWGNDKPGEGAFWHWCRAQDALQEKWRRLSGDDDLGLSPYSDTSYRIVTTPLDGGA